MKQMMNRLILVVFSAGLVLGATSTQVSFENIDRKVKAAWPDRKKEQAGGFTPVQTW